MANYSQSQQNLYVQQMNRSRSSSPGPQFNQQQQQQLTPQQQQWMAQQYAQQYQQQKSMNDLMAQHQKQWAEHMAMTSQKNVLQQVPASPQSSPSPRIAPQQPQNYGSAMNLNHNNGSAMNLNQNMNNNNNQYTAAQYAAWQRQYQQGGGVAASAMNMQQMQNYRLQQQRMAQMAQYQQQQQQMQQMQQQQSQRALYQNQMRQQQQQPNYSKYKSTGNLINNNRNAFQYQRQGAQSQNRIGDMRNNKLDEEQEVDHQHETFVPPAPQSNQEIEKYVNWKAKRQGIDEQKAINKEVARQQKLAAMEVEKDKDKKFGISKNDVADFKQPLLENRSHKESDIDYELLNNNDGGQSGGCCCTVL